MSLEERIKKMFEHSENLPLGILRKKWTQYWGKEPHGTMGRTMILQSLQFKKWEQETGGLKSEKQKHLDKLIMAYKRNPNSFDKAIRIKPGTRLDRTWKGKKYSVTVKYSGYEYEGKIHTSLSQIANKITGSRWNGWVFFGLKKARSS